MLGDVLLFLALVVTGLVTGLFYAWSVAAVPGLRTVPDQTYIAAMQSINRAILNPLFLGPFLSAVLLLVAATVAAFLAGHEARGWWSAAASATYGVGVLGVTVARNVPLNEELDRFDASTADEWQVAEQRRHYESGWNRWQNRRAVVGVVAFALVAVAALVR